MFIHISGLHLENFISSDMSNVTLTVLEGKVVYEIENGFQSVGEKLEKGESVPVEVDTFHRVHTMSPTPSYYMYTFVRNKPNEQTEDKDHKYVMYSPFPFLEKVDDRVEAFLKMWRNIAKGLINLVFGIPYNVIEIKM